ncbi:hypothetical protein A4U49_02740 [Acidithiobacillus ferrivorans]|jgi:hypothetical protein|uniref:hypothetical protein n=1 Tax=Acidithiobacillus ferrivorans TaxID=160808 RepID=UPI0005A0C847|nr:hypothetical protein [Acidithiobacillus ferrivorans]OFA17397.1 hypothetical protein A4U49_02740 [Acidithiobacillus ferrivorans]
MTSSPPVPKFTSEILAYFYGDIKQQLLRYGNPLMKLWFALKPAANLHCLLAYKAKLAITAHGAALNAHHSQIYHSISQSL